MFITAVLAVLHIERAQIIQQLLKLIFIYIYSDTNKTQYFKLRRSD